MIARLSGRLLEVHDDAMVIDVHGVGYLVQASGRLLANLPALGTELDLTIETQVRDDSITLIGFTDAAERRAFRLLHAIQGVGTRVALAVLGTLEPGALAQAVQAKDRVAIARAPGVGPRLAQRIVTELEPKLGAIQEQSAPTLVTESSGAPANALEAAVSALTNLGYGRVEAVDAVNRAQSDLGASAGEAAVLKRALQHLAAAVHG